MVRPDPVEPIACGDGLTTAWHPSEATECKPWTSLGKRLSGNLLRRRNSLARALYFPPTFKHSAAKPRRPIGCSLLGGSPESGVALRESMSGALMATPKSGRIPVPPSKAADATVVAGKQRRPHSAGEGRATLADFRAGNAEHKERGPRGRRALLGMAEARLFEELGALLLKEFYDDDPELYESTSHSKPAALAEVASRCEKMGLPFGRTYIGRALQIAVLARRLRKQAQFWKLPLSHRAELLPLGAPDKIEAMASRAVKENLSVRSVRALVRIERLRRFGDGRKGSMTRGRKPYPKTMKAVVESKKLLCAAWNDRNELLKRDLDRMREPQRSRLLSDARLVQETIASIIKFLEG